MIDFAMKSITINMSLLGSSIDYNYTKHCN